MSEIKEKETKTSLENNIINILKHVNNDYSLLLIFLINGNHIDLHDKDTIYRIFTNPNLNIKILLQLSKYLNINISTLSEYLSDNGSITEKDIETHPEIQWNYNKLSNNNNITWSFINKIISDKNYKNLPKDKQWNIHLILKTNNSIRIENFEEIKSQFKIKKISPYLSYNSIITPKFVENNPQIKWDIKGLARNPNFSWKYLLEHYYKDNEPELCIYYSKNPNLRIKDITSNLEYWVDWLDDKKDEFNIWINLTINPAISIQDIVDHPNLPWDYGIIGLNYNLTFKTIIDNWYFGFDIRQLLANLFNTNKYIKERKNIVFPKYYWITNSLYNILSREKDQKEVYHDANKLFSNVNNNIFNILEFGNTRIIKNYNDDLDKPEYSIYGLIKNELIILLKSFTDKNINHKNVDISIIINDELLILDKLVNWYKKYGGSYIESKKLIKSQCGEENENEFFTQQEFKDLELKDLISFEFQNKVYCVDRQSLIDFWNQEPDEFDKSQAYKWGNCESEEGKYEEECEKFYKIPISITILITEDSKNEIIKSKDINYWKLKYSFTSTIGRGSGYEGEYNQPDEKIYEVEPILQITKD